MATRSPTARGDAGADRLDDADALVAGDERRRRLDRPVAVGGVDVGVAQAARLDADQDLAGSGLGDGRSWISRGWVKSVTTAAFMALLLG